MPHFYVKPENIKGNTFTINGEQAHYLANVRRFKVDDEIMIFDGAGNSYKAKITSINKNAIAGNILFSLYNKISNPIIRLHTSMPKNSRFEWLIEKCAEIGVYEIALINTKRSINTGFSKNKLKRYEKISTAASSQCGRNDIMKINEPVDFKTACKNAATDKHFINILPWENENNSRNNIFINNILEKKARYKGVNIFIGPEGGFENAEIKLAKSLDFQTVTLGNNILRVETAAIVASALILNFTRFYK